MSVIRALGASMDRLLNSGKAVRDTGFILLVFPLGSRPGVSFVTNCQRADAIVALREFLGRLEGRAHDAPETRQ